MRFLVASFVMLFCSSAFAGSFVVDGVRFNSIKEWRSSRYYDNMVLERALDEFDIKYSYRNLSKENDLDILRRYNSDRTTYGLRSGRSQIHETTKQIMGWKSFPK